VITWLASYPRSGDTLLRTVLKCCFGQFGQSIYCDEEFEHPALKEIVGKEAVGASLFEFVSTAKRQNRHLYVKTHELPRDNAQPTIYVVRDGRSCVVSHYHYVRDILGRDVTLEDVIRGAWCPSWSQHVDAWALSGRQNTLVVHYEGLATGCLRTLRAISAFINQPLLREFDASFDQLHALYPSFFRRGSDEANLDDLDANNALLFERLHGETPRKIGYGGQRHVSSQVPTTPAYSPP
jgi:hypothetical protein